MSGGFTQSPDWVRQIADLFGIPFTLSEEADASATGAIVLAMLAMGTISGITQVSQMFKREKTVYPRPGIHQVYQGYFRIYQQLYPSLSPTLHQLHSKDS